MATIVFYVDESGSSDKFTIPIENGKTPIFTLSAVALELERWRDYDRRFNALKAEFFPDVLKNKSRKEEIEIKGNELTSPRNRSSSRRHEFLTRTLRLLRENDAKLFGVTFLKSANIPIPSTSMYTHGFQVLLERFHDYVVGRGRNESGIIICDSRAGAIKANGLDKEVATSFQSYVFGNAKGKRLTSVHEAPLFADSKITVGIQLADIVSACLYSSHYHYYARELQGAIDYEHMRGYWKMLDDLQYKSAPVEQKYTTFGFRVIDHRQH